MSKQQRLDEAYGQRTAAHVANGEEWKEPWAPEERGGEQ